MINYRMLYQCNAGLFRPSEYQECIHLDLIKYKDENRGRNYLCFPHLNAKQLPYSFGSCLSTTWYYRFCDFSTNETIKLEHFEFGYCWSPYSVLVLTLNLNHLIKRFD